MRLSELRKEYKLSLRALSKKASLSLAYLSQLETNPQKNPSVRTAKLLADVFNISIEDLMELETNYKKPKYCNEKCEPISCRGAFCIGKCDENIIVINGKTHTNTYYFCIISPLRGWSKFQINKSDIEIIKDMLALASESEGE